MKSVAWVGASAEPTFSADATCERCGRRGTVGYVARGDGIPVVRARYCFRCWPNARRAAQQDWQRESDEGDAAMRRWLEQGAEASGLAEPVDVKGLTVQAGWRGMLAQLCALTAARTPSRTPSRT